MLIKTLTFSWVDSAGLALVVVGQRSPVAPSRVSHSSVSHLQVDRSEGGEEEVGRDGDVDILLLSGGQHRFDAETNLGQEPKGEEIWEEDPLTACLLRTCDSGCKQNWSKL